MLRLPPVTILVLLLANVGVFLLSAQNADINKGYGLIPNQIAEEPIRLITSMFLHADAIHLLMNMIVLLSFSSFLREIGSLKFLAIYLLGGLGGSLTVWMLSDPQSVTVGASGAIYAVFGGFLSYLGKNSGAMGSMIVVLAINLIYTFSIPNISWQGHVGGLLAGIIIGGVLKLSEKTYSKSRRKQDIPGTTQGALK